MDTQYRFGDSQEFQKFSSKGKHMNYIAVIAVVALLVISLISFLVLHKKKQGALLDGVQDNVLPGNTLVASYDTHYDPTAVQTVIPDMRVAQPVFMDLMAESTTDLKTAYGSDYHADAPVKATPQPTTMPAIPMLVNTPIQAFAAQGKGSDSAEVRMCKDAYCGHSNSAIKRRNCFNACEKTAGKYKQGLPPQLVEKRDRNLN